MNPSIGLLVVASSHEIYQKCQCKNRDNISFMFKAYVFCRVVWKASGHFEISRCKKTSKFLAISSSSVRQSCFNCGTGFLSRSHFANVQFGFSYNNFVVFACVVVNQAKCGSCSKEGYSQVNSTDKMFFVRKKIRGNSHTENYSG